MAPDVDFLRLPPVPSVPLSGAPLVRVIAQIRFSAVLDIEDSGRVNDFCAALQSVYPVVRREQVAAMVFGPHPPPAIAPTWLWRVSDVAGEWRVSLAPDFLTLETTCYANRRDFLGRWDGALKALAQHVRPPLTDRVGLRYINRLTGDDVANLAQLVRPEVLGVSSTVTAVHAMTEALFTGDDAQMLARWGHLPAGATIDPMSIEAVDQVSWVLDLDVFTTRPVPFRSDVIMATVSQFSDRIYSAFRWVLTDAWLSRHRGAP